MYPKVKHDTFGKRAFAVCGSLSWNLGYTMKLFVWRYMINLVNLNLLPTHICVTRLQWVKTEKDNELASPRRFSNQIGIYIYSTREILRFAVILSKALIYGGYFRFPKSWCRPHFNKPSYCYWIKDLAHSIRWLLFVRSRCDQTLDWY